MSFLNIYNFLSRLLVEEDGAEVLEYVLIAGIISVSALIVVSKVGTKVLARWTSLNSSM